MGQTLYWECGTGISGDMIVASLLDLGADENKLREVLAGIPEDGFEVRIGRVSKSGIDCCDFDVVLDAAHENHDHDMAYLYGHEELSQDAEEHDHHHHDHQEHSHDDHGHHEHHDHHGHHHHTNLAEVTAIIQALAMTDHAREIALRTFTILAEAESKAHGLPIEQIHFHEVGAIDSIVDIVAAAVCLDDLDITGVIVPCLCEGTGTVRCQHGVLPVPVPAVLNVVSAHQLPLRITNRHGELVTPTGAAFVAATITGRELPETFVPVKVGLGAGKRAYEIPSILRGMLIEPVQQNVPAESDTIIRLECNIDDSTGEQLGYAMEQLFLAGARDVHYHPVMMKKNRPAWQLNVITDEAHRKALEELIFRETTTIGIRRIAMERTVLARHEETVTTPYGDIRVKVCSGSGVTRVYPEYESVAAAARASGAAYADVFRAAENAH